MPKALFLVPQRDRNSDDNLWTKMNVFSSSPVIRLPSIGPLFLSFNSLSSTMNVQLREKVKKAFLVSFLGKPILS